MIRYHHRQFATAIVTSLFIATAGALVLGFALPVARYLPLGAAFLFAVCAFIFSSLTIEVTDRSLRWWFGPGLLKKEVPLHTIQDVKTGKSRLADGWGIHYTGKGKLYNASGYPMIIVDIAAGPPFMLGTDEPERLQAAILDALAAATRNAPRPRPGG